MTSISSGYWDLAVRGEWHLERWELVGLGIGHVEVEELPHGEVSCALEYDKS